MKRERELKEVLDRERLDRVVSNARAHAMLRIWLIGMMLMLEMPTVQKKWTHQM